MSTPATHEDIQAIAIMILMFWLGGIATLVLIGEAILKAIIGQKKDGNK